MSTKPSVVDSVFHDKAHATALPHGQTSTSVMLIDWFETAEGSREEQKGQEKKGGEEKKPEPSPAPSAPPKASSQSEEKQEPHAGGRQPSIKFPRRRLPNGQRISDLPVEEQRRCSRSASW